MRNVQMRGLFDNPKIATRLVVALALAAVAFEVNPAQAAARRGGTIFTANHQRLSRYFAKGMAVNREYASEANAGNRRGAANEAQAGASSRLRDPFKVPELPSTSSTVKGKSSHLPAVLPPGVRGLLIDQLMLQGVVDKQPGNTMIAVVTNKTNRAYFLRANEQVFDGTVTRITPAAIYFEQRYYDANDKAEWRTVEKRLSGPGGTK